MSFNITKPSYDKEYLIYAWRNNNIRLIYTQGEGIVSVQTEAVQSSESEETAVAAGSVKVPRFKLNDERGAINLTDCTVAYAIVRPDGSEDLLSCSIENATTGLISCPIVSSMTAFPGDVRGEIRVYSDNAVIKFYGINAVIHRGVSDDAIEQSPQFSALTQALQSLDSVERENKQGYVTPEMFGAKGDGVTDDAEALRAAINKAIKENVPFRATPNRCYLIESSVDIDFVSQLPNSTEAPIPQDPNTPVPCPTQYHYLCGDFDFNGAEIKVKKDKGLAYAIRFICIANAHNDVHSKVGVRNLTINGNDESVHTGLYIERSRAAVFENINIFGCRRGILMEDSGESIIKECTARRTSSLDLFNQLRESLENDTVVNLLNPFSGTDKDNLKNRTEEMWNESNDWILTSIKPTDRESASQEFADEIKITISRPLTSEEKTNKEQQIGEDPDPDGDGRTEEEMYYSSAEIINDFKINLTKTQCVGFEITSADTFIENCVAIDFVIGIKLAAGDIKVDGCHPWNMSINQLHSACCFMTNGNNFFTNNTCDRFYIGIYCNLNLPSFFVNTLFTNQALNNPETNNQKDDSIALNYCWYLNPAYAGKTKGQTVVAKNTRVHGNRKRNRRDLYWCNYEDYRINDTGTVGYNLLKYRPNVIEDGYLARITCTGGTIRIAPDCKNISVASNGGNGVQRGILKSDHCIFSVSRQQGSTDLADFVYTIKGLDNNFPTSSYARLNIGTKYFVAGRKYFLYFKYTNTDLHADVKFNNSVSSASDKADDILRTFSNDVGKERALLTDGEEHDYYNVFTAKQGTYVSIGYDGMRDGGSQTYVPSENALSISQVCLYDITDVPRYYMENGSAYAKRIYDLYLSECADAGHGIIDDIVIGVDNSIRDTTSFKSLSIPINFNYSTNASSSSVKQSEADHNYYDIGYDDCGRPLFHSTAKYDNIHMQNNVARLRFNAHTLAMDIMVTNAPRAHTPAPFSAECGGDVRSFVSTATNTNSTNSENVDHTLGIVFNKTEAQAKLFFYPYVNNNESDKNPTTIPISSVRIGKQFGCDDPVVDSGGLIPVYYSGEVYVVKRDCKPWDVEQGQDKLVLPTVMYQLETVEESPHSLKSDVYLKSQLSEKNLVITNDGTAITYKILVVS